MSQSVKFIKNEVSGTYIGDYNPVDNAHVQVRKFGKGILSSFT